jgi:hypothetical protein
MNGWTECPQGELAALASKLWMRTWMWRVGLGATIIVGGITAAVAVSNYSSELPKYGGHHGCCAGSACGTEAASGCGSAATNGDDEPDDDPEP